MLKLIEPKKWFWFFDFILLRMRTKLDALVRMRVIEKFEMKKQNIMDAARIICSRWNTKIEFLQTGHE